MSSSAPPAGRVPAASRSSGPSGPAPRHAPALLITAPASGHGKTTVVAALARRLTRDGLTVRVFKTGPDFLDPAWHTLASGHTVHNLDLWMTGEHDIRRRLYEAALDADLIIVEGVMGLYDGEPSAAELAHAFDLPVLAVIDASSMTGTFGALAHGLRTWMPGLRWAGAIANRVASPRHAHLIASASQRPGMEASVDCSQGPDCYLGHIRRDAAFGLPARHLGLIAASELPDALARLDAAADALDDTVLGQLNRDSLQAWRTPFTALPVASDLHANSVRPLAGRTIAVARDSAFAFIYPANLDTLAALGATLCFFSPLADEPLPPCDAVWLPGGYPELYAETLSACRRLPATLRAHVEANRPVWAECGGMLPLFERMTHDGRGWSMWGILPGHIDFQKRLGGLGMQQLDDWPPVRARQRVAVTPSLVPPPSVDAQVSQPSLTVAQWDASRTADIAGPAEASQAGFVPVAPPLRGHTFHYSLCTTPLPEVARTHRPGQPVSPDQGEAVYAYRQLHASYFHAWFAGSPARTAALFLPAGEGA